MVIAQVGIWQKLLDIFLNRAGILKDVCCQLRHVHILNIIWIKVTQQSRQLRVVRHEKGHGSFLEQLPAQRPGNGDSSVLVTRVPLSVADPRFLPKERLGGLSVCCEPS
jgi:hypothetical protein